MYQDDCNICIKVMSIPDHFMAVLQCGWLNYKLLLWQHNPACPVSLFLIICVFDRGGLSQTSVVLLLCDHQSFVIFLLLLLQLLIHIQRSLPTWFMFVLRQANVKVESRKTITVWLSGTFISLTRFKKNLYLLLFVGNTGKMYTGLKRWWFQDRVGHSGVSMVYQWRPSLHQTIQL